MADDDTQPTPAREPADAGGTGSARPGVSIPSWMAAALVVVLALVIGGVGFALGRSTADDVQQIEPIANVPLENGQLPVPPGLEERGGPRDPGVPGERGERHERGECAEEGEGDEGDRDDGEDADGQQDDDEQPQPGLDQDQGEGF